MIALGLRGGLMYELVIVGRLSVALVQLGNQGYFRTQLKIDD